VLVSKLELTNWRNFTNADMEFADTTYIIGPNASGKSNLLDVFRFLRDLVTQRGGGFQQAIASRGGLSKMRSLAARRHPRVGLKVELRESTSESSVPAAWAYRLEIATEKGGTRRPLVHKEEVLKNGGIVLCRPEREDDRDKERLTQTHLEQINMNGKFRELAQFFREVSYLHLVPQLLKYGREHDFALESDPFGQRFLEEIAKSQKRTRESRLKRIEAILKKVIPNLTDLRFVRDEDTGRPHLEMRYQH